MLLLKLTLSEPQETREWYCQTEPSYRNQKNVKELAFKQSIQWHVNTVDEQLDSCTKIE
jgi:hypothetical protein